MSSIMKKICRASETGNIILNAFLEVGGQDCTRNEENMPRRVGNVLLNVFFF